MSEYVYFTKAIYFKNYDPVGDNHRKMQIASKDRFLLEYAFQNKAQVKPEYTNNEEGQCVITTVGVKLDYTVVLFGFGFNIKKMSLFYPEKFLGIFFNNIIGGNAVTNYICDTVLCDKCQDVYKANGLNETNCKQKYNNLPPVDAYGYLDDYAKGYRIFHSVFVAINPKHCPHMSFIPIKDYHDEFWCQKSGGTKAEDLFSEDELTNI